MEAARKFEGTQEEWNTLVLKNKQMNKPFKKLLGNRVLLKTPALPETKLQLSKEAQESIKQSYLEKLDKLEVYAIGDSVTTVTEGDIVTIPITLILNSQKIKISDDLEVCLVSVYDISIIW